MNRRGSEQVTGGHGISHRENRGGSSRCHHNGPVQRAVSDNPLICIQSWSTDAHPSQGTRLARLPVFEDFRKVVVINKNLVVMLALVSSFGASQASAQETRCDAPQVLIVLDRSSSMGERAPLADGTLKWTAATAALHTLVSE